MFYSFYIYYAGKVISGIGMGDKDLSMAGSILTPALVFVGAGLVRGKPTAASALFVIAAAMVFATIGLNGASVFFGGPVLIAGALAFYGTKELSELTTQKITQGDH